MFKKFNRSVKKRLPRIRECFLCKQKIEPDYKEVEALKHNISERGKIIPRVQSGVCQKHQRKLMQAVKRARILAFLPFIERPS